MAFACVSSHCAPPFLPPLSRQALITWSFKVKAYAYLTCADEACDNGGRRGGTQARSTQNLFLFFKAIWVSHGLWHSSTMCASFLLSHAPIIFSLRCPLIALPNRRIAVIFIAKPWLKCASVEALYCGVILGSLS